jgi:hypothetical protein
VQAESSECQEVTGAAMVRIDTAVHSESETVQLHFLEDCLYTLPEQE